MILGINNRDVIEIMLDDKPLQCKKCYSRLYYKEEGLYSCIECGRIYQDDFAKIKEYVENHDNCTPEDVARETIIDIDVVRALLDENTFENLPWEKYFLECTKCGCAIKQGRYCQWCQQGVGNGILAAFAGGDKETMKVAGYRQKSRGAKESIHYIGKK
ncbi:MAG: hypothetical protein ACI4E1_02040 [Lachnospira sp.]